MAEEKKLLDPKQELFLENYLNPKNSNFGNALKSALAAGYSQEYSENITSLMPDWLSESIGNIDVLKKAEKRLNETLDLEVKEGDKVDSNLLRIVIDVAKFVAERIGKNKYSTKQEVEHSGEIEHEVKLNEETAKILEEFIAYRKTKI